MLMEVGMYAFCNRCGCFSGGRVALLKRPCADPGSCLSGRSAAARVLLARLRSGCDPHTGEYIALPTALSGFFGHAGTCAEATLLTPRREDDADAAAARQGA